MFIANNVQ
jgi:obg-like ATPase 1